MNNYEQFTYEASVIAAIYPVSPLQQNMYEEYEQDEVPNNELAAKKDLKRSVLELSKYSFSYWEFALIKLGSCFTCVFKCFCWVCCWPCMLCWCLGKRRNHDRPRSSAKKNCCLRLQMRYDRHEKARKMFDEEFDIVKII